MRFTDIRYRYWAFKQYLKDRKENPSDSGDAKDFARYRRRFFFAAVILGRVTDRCYAAIDSDFPELRKQSVLDDDAAVLRIADEHLAKYVAMGEDRSGFVAGFLEAQRRHLAGCSRCKAAIVACIRSDIDTARKVRYLFDDLGPDAKRRLVEEFVPPHMRRRDDTTLN